MAKVSASCFLSLVLLVFISVENMVPRVDARCELSVIGGGCPDLEKCIETCRPCYRGIGKIKATCRPAGGGILWDQCICDFLDGAPCQPPAPPRCPNPPGVVASIKHFDDE